GLDARFQTIVGLAPFFREGGFGCCLQQFGRLGSGLGAELEGRFFTVEFVAQRAAPHGFKLACNLECARIVIGERAHFLDRTLNRSQLPGGEEREREAEYDQHTKPTIDAGFDSETELHDGTPERIAQSARSMQLPVWRFRRGTV